MTKPHENIKELLDLKAQLSNPRGNNLTTDMKVTILGEDGIALADLVDKAFLSVKKQKMLLEEQIMMANLDLKWGTPEQNNHH